MRFRDFLLSEAKNVYTIKKFKPSDKNSFNIKFTSISGKFETESDALKELEKIKEIGCDYQILLNGRRISSYSVLSSGKISKM